MTEYETNKLLLENKEKPLEIAFLNPSVKKAFKDFTSLNKEDFAVCGGIAASVYLQARMTMDVDIIISGSIDDVVSEVGSCFKKLTSFSVEHKSTGVEIEALTGRVINLPQELLDKAIAEAKEHSFNGMIVKVITPKFLVAMKLGRAIKNIPKKSAQDTSDIEGITLHYGVFDLTDLNLPKEEIDFYKNLCDRVQLYKDATSIL